ncbi:tetratricopeptide repeat protein [Pseudonocardia cypriaca]|uniref:Tetratricopeptide repeat protein n=1 Tax=Pseudonocardia cypriaca TaxID=882449 RepID=A0A543GCV9_9PSEU|nr:tetratricopeptide repeat protein [Pseudonocardia cypriaca]TQM43890.1 tetratricopeptide repeat protein [Pseudonocardia cypriaca]
MGSGVDAWLLINVARALLDADRPADARALLDRAQDLVDDDVEVYRTRGFANAILGVYTAANSDLERAARSGTDSWLTALRAEVLRVSGHPDDALALFAELDPADELRWVAASRAAAMAALGDVDGALAAYAEALRRDPRDVNSLCGLGELELDRHRPGSGR